MILAIDTSAGQCAIALLSSETSVSRVQAMDRGHAEALFPMIEDALRECGASYGDITKAAVCTGPGSFTGLRAGIAAARGLALGRGIPAVGVTRFEALAAVERQACTIRLKGRGSTVFAQDFGADGMAAGAPRVEEGTADDLLPDPLMIARLAMDRETSIRPAPLYMRDADAALPAQGPPRLLD